MNARAAVAILWLLALAGPAAALDCRRESFEGRSYALCRLSPEEGDLRLFLNDANGQPFGEFSAVEAAFPDKRLVFAMNAGMYHPDRAAVGYYVEGGEAQTRLLTSASPGNFGLLPNGVLCLTADSAEVIETRRFAEEEPACDYATQSGPMLVIDGKLHPRFLESSTSRYVRNGVGTSASGDEAVFVISDEPVTFWEFGSFFRDFLGIDQALFLDGNVSRLHAPDFGRSDAGRAMGPIVGLLVDPPEGGG
ncbi:phosphodiester glycosidase family protein [Pseudoroseicyclus sp. CXY001]|uniref:phosphodiester glycosidase family protein n=1 Tax=Pseudoroseicyclus sp. CXY001 TaxID=3242492 RepID=UPI0035714AE2